ncbi:MAG: hypothetical protein HY078_09230 [Elusimicrobia bacterium]|nr:hypothetical protein [Elusimicrobiota bacterium]
MILPALLLLLAAPATAGDRKAVPKFGVCFHHGAFGDEYTPGAAVVLDDLRKKGPFWIRGDFQDPKKDAPFAKDMAAKGIQVLALLPWYSTNTAGWRAFVEKAVQATPAVPAWEITNEPEMTWWGGPLPAGEYVRMLKEAKAIIRKANPKALLIGPAIGANADGVKYLSALVDAGLLDHVDGVSAHYYIFHKNLDLAGVKKAVGGKKPIWITETGWTTADQPGGEEAQEKYVRDYYDPKQGVLGADPEIRVIIHYELNDDRDPVPPGKDDGWGLTHGPKGAFKKKPAFAAFKSLL